MALLKLKVCSFCGSWDNCEFCDEAHISDMRELRKEQLAEDIKNGKEG